MQDTLRTDLTAKVQAHERKAQLCARELANLRRSAEQAHKHVQALEEEARRNKSLLKVSFTVWPRTIMCH